MSLHQLTQQPQPDRQTERSNELALLLSHALVYVEHYACMNNNRAAEDLAARINAQLALDTALSAATRRSADQIKRG